MWQVISTDTFEYWYKNLLDADRNNVAAHLLLLQDQGANLSRPYADTLKGSTLKNLKELRVQSKGKPLRIFFVFDPLRQAILLCAGDKTGDKRFYKRMIPLAEQEYKQHIEQLERENGKNT